MLSTELCVASAGFVSSSIVVVVAVVIDVGEDGSWAVVAVVVVVETDGVVGDVGLAAAGSDLLPLLPAVDDV